MNDPGRWKHNATIPAMNYAWLSLIFLVPLLAAQTVTEVEITAEPAHHLAMENEYVRVFQVEAAPHAATLMHRHRHDYIFITLGNSHISNQIEGKEPIDVTLDDGEARFVGGNFAHIATNLSERPFRNVTIELMQDEKMRSAPSRWPEESGEKIAPGVVRKVLFIKDGARISSITLEAGATVPSHHHDGPHLFVAVNDCNLRSEIEGSGPIDGRFKSGDVKWMHGNYTHTLTNTGKQPAQFVTVEF